MIERGALILWIEDFHMLDLGRAECVEHGRRRGSEDAGTRCRTGRRIHPPVDGMNKVMPAPTAAAGTPSRVPRPLDLGTHVFLWAYACAPNLQ